MMPTGHPELPGYRLVETLGRGGFATVYRAWQLAVGREVALKIDERLLASPRHRQRFMREVTAAGQLSDHPHVVALHDAGVLGDGRPYMVLELCPGGSLADRLRTHGPLPPAQARDVGVHIADALAAAHNAGVLHRDVKPGNLLVNRFGEVALADFGLAAMPRPGHELSATRDALTPAYAPPEAFRMADPQPVGDVYSLAATVYALLRGRPPHYPDEGELNLAELIVRHTQPVSDLPGVSPALTGVLRRAMAADPEHRLPTAMALRDALAGADLYTHHLAASVPTPRTGAAPSRPAGPQSAAPGAASATTRDAPPYYRPPYAPGDAGPASPDPADGTRTDPPADSRGGGPGRRRAMLLTAVLAVAAAVLGVSTAVTALRDPAPKGKPDASESSPSTRTTVRGGGSPGAGHGMTVPTVTRGCPAASVAGADARCTKTAECWGGMVITVGIVTVTRFDCAAEHVWETFAIAPLPSDGQTNNQKELARHPAVRKVCSREVMARSRVGEARRFPSGDWLVEPLPPTQSEFERGVRVYRCVATVIGKSRAGVSFRPRS